MTTQQRLRAFDRRTRAAAIANGALKGWLRAWIALVVSLLCMQALDHFVALPGFLLRSLWGASGILTLALFGSGFFPLSQFSLKERSRQVHNHCSGLRVDDVRVALELAAKQHVPSLALRDNFTQRTAQRLDTVRAWAGVARWNWKLAVIAAAVVLGGAVGLHAALPMAFPFSGRFLFPFFNADWRNNIAIEPGDARVALGGSIKIRVRIAADLFEAPELFVKTGRSWERRAGESDQARTYVYAIDHIVLPVSYRVRWKNEWSERFTLTPVEPLAIRAWAIKLTPPPYTGQPPREQVAPEIRGLAGTRVEIFIESNAPLKRASLMFADGTRVPSSSVNGKTAAFAFDLKQTATYRVVLESVAEMPRAEPDSYGVNVLSDEAPQITLLSPERDIVIGDNETCPLTFEARDDVALGRVDLAWQEQNGRSGGRAIKTYSSSLDRDLDTYEWHLDDTGFRPGSVVRFRLEVSDKNTVTGPGKAVSDWRVVEIRSFDREHTAIEKSLEAWRDQAVAALAQATTLQAKAEDEKQVLSALTAEGQKLGAQLDALNESMKSLVDRMEKDPLADYGVALEHRQMQQTLEHLARTTAPSTQAALQTQNRAAAKGGLEETSNELERMTALSENLSKNQKARDVLQSGEDLEKAGEDIARALEDGKLTPEARAKINQLLEEAQKQLAQMAHALQDMPQELPEDFVNQDAVKNLELGKSQDLLQQINDAMAKGDAAGALALAQKFLAMAQGMNKQLSKAHESFTEAHSAEKLAEQIGEQSKELDKITERQSKLLDQTQRIASQQFSRHIAEQAGKLAALAARQQRIIDVATALDADSAWPPPLLPAKSALGRCVYPMREILAEMQSKKLLRTGELMPSLLGQLNAIQMLVATSSAPETVSGRTATVFNDESALWDDLKKLSGGNAAPTPEEKNQTQALKTEQSDVETQTQKLRKNLRELSQKTASLGAPLMHALAQAGSNMHDSSGSLSEGQAPSSQASQERALDELRSAQESMQAAQSMMSEMAMEQSGSGGDTPGGSGGHVKVLARPGGAAGSHGANAGKVRLPTAEDYRPPKAFREDLLEALKEKYPKTYEDIIRQYYKRLAN